MFNNKQTSLSSMVLVPVTGSSVSSTLQRNAKEYGKKFLFDGCPDTCWNSDQGESQHVGVRFAQHSSVKRIKIQVLGLIVTRDIALFYMFSSTVLLVLLSNVLPFFSRFFCENMILHYGMMNVNN